MKNKRLKILPCLALLVLFTIIQFSNLKFSYQELLNSSGLNLADFDKKLQKENERSSQNETNQNIVSEQDYSGKEETKENNNNAENQKVLNLHALSSLLLDASNNRVLYEENGYKEMAMASTTKIMTCIVALENSKSGEIVTVSSYAASMPDVQLNIKPGEQYYLRDLLYSLMLESHNDVAVAIAEHVGGSVEGFATMMNDKARALGCEHTNFITPNGLDAKGHYTTARDLAVIASYAIQNKKFIEITNTSAHEFSEIKKGRSFHVSNKDRFLYMMDGAIGIKTGFTNDAGYCFVGAMKREDRTFVSVVLGCGWPPSKSLKWSDTKALMTYGIDNYKEKQIFQDVNLEPVFVNNGQQRYEALDMEGDLRLLIRDNEEVTVKYEIPKALQAPVKAGNVVGYAKYYINDTFYTEIPIYTKSDIAKINYKYCFTKLLQFWSQQY